MGDDTPLMTIDEAWAVVSACVPRGATESERLAESLGRVTAQPVVCDMDYPPFAKAMMDGYAVRSVDVGDGVGDRRLRLVGQIAAGDGSDVRVGSGEAVQINTGARLPVGADAVVRVEDTSVSGSGDEVLIHVGVVAGRHVDPRAKYVSAGSRVIESGVRLGAAHVAVAAAAGADVLRVHARPRVSVLVTGDELVDVSERATGATIRNSNGPMLVAMLAGGGAIVRDLGVVGDDRVSLERGIRDGLGGDFLCISGGISMGAFDFVPQVLDACGVGVVVRKIAIRPGKPTLVGVAESGTVVFALPGNPLAGFVVFELLVRPALAAFEGLGWRPPAPVSVGLRGGCPATGDRDAYSPGRVEIDVDGKLVVERLSWHGSSDLFGFSRANGLIVRARGSEAVESGATVSVIPLGRFEGGAALD